MEDDQRAGNRPAQPCPPARPPSRGSDAGLDLAERLLLAEDAAQAAAALLASAVASYGSPRGAVLGRRDRRLSPLALHGVTARSSASGSSPAVERALGEDGASRLRLAGEQEPWLARLLPAGAELVVVPLRSTDGRPLGALVLEAPAGSPADDGPGLRQLERSARWAGAVLHRAQRISHLQRLAATDDLTLIANRRGFLASLDRELARSVRAAQPVALVLLDIDKFKSVNDLHGHPAGDEALRNVAAALTIACRDLDTAARYGGEEFAVILPDCEADRALDIAERLRAAVRAAPAARPLTASAGVAVAPVHARDAEQLVRAADVALLQAKRSGRDRTVMAAGPEGADAADPDPDQAGPPD